MITWNEFPDAGRYTLTSEDGTYRMERDAKGWHVFKSGADLGTYRAMRYAMKACEQDQETYGGTK